MNEFELIAAMLEDLNWRIVAMEVDSEGRGADDKKFRELLSRLQTLNEAKVKVLRKGLPK